MNRSEWDPRSISLNRQIQGLHPCMAVTGSDLGEGVTIDISKHSITFCAEDNLNGLYLRYNVKI